MDTRMETRPMPDETTTPPTKIKFIFKKSEDYKLHFVNGAYGGFTTHGDLICNFFFESQGMPTEQEADIEGTQIKFHKVKHAEVPEYMRDVKFGIIMTPQQAVSLRNWLNKQIKDFGQKFKAGKGICEPE